MLREIFQPVKNRIKNHQIMNLPLIPGQPIYHPLVEEEMRKNPYFTDPNELKEIGSQILEKTLDIFGCKKHRLFYINGSYRHALDIALINAVEKEDIVLLIGDSKWHRSLQKRLLFFCNGADIFPFPTSLTSETLNETMENLAAQIEEKPYKIVMISHTLERDPRLLPINEVAKIANSANSFVLLDAHTTAGTIPIDQTNRFDVIVASSNWGLASAPGLGLLAISDELTADIAAQQRDLPPTLDLDYWQALTEILNKGRIPESFEFAPNELRALNVSLELLIKHREDYQTLQKYNALAIRMILAAFGFDLQITLASKGNPEKNTEEKSIASETEKNEPKEIEMEKKDQHEVEKDEDQFSDDLIEFYSKMKENLQKQSLAPTYTTFQIPEALNAREFYEQLLKQRLYIRLSSEKERLFQIGHVGYLTNEHLFATMRAIYDALADLKSEFVTSKRQQVLLEAMLAALI